MCQSQNMHTGNIYDSLRKKKISFLLLVYHSSSGYDKLWCTPIFTQNSHFHLILLKCNLLAPNHYHVIKIFICNQIKFNLFNLAHQTPDNIDRAKCAPYKQYVIISETQKKVHFFFTNKLFNHSTSIS